MFCRYQKTDELFKRLITVFVVGMIKIHPSTRFKRSFKKIPSHVKKDFGEKIEIFKHQPFHPSLRAHKLNGNLSDYRAFYLCDGFRVMFEFVELDVALLINVGSHDQYKKWERG